MERLIILIIGCVGSCVAGWLLGYFSLMDERRKMKKRIQDLELFSSRIIANTCIVCGEIIPEGRQVCPKCEEGKR